MKLKFNLKLAAFVMTLGLIACKHEYTCDCTVYEFMEETDEVETIYIEDTRNNAKAKCASMSYTETEDTTNIEIYSYRCELR